MLKNSCDEIRNTSCNEAICHDPYRALILSSFASFYSASRKIGKLCYLPVQYFFPASQIPCIEAPSINSCEINNSDNLGLLGHSHAALACLLTTPVAAAQSALCCSLSITSASIGCVLCTIFPIEDRGVFFLPALINFRFANFDIFSKKCADEEKRFIKNYSNLSKNQLDYYRNKMSKNDMNFLEFLSNLPSYLENPKNAPQLNKNDGVTKKNLIFCHYAYEKYRSNKNKEKYSSYQNNYFYQNFVIDFNDHPVTQLKSIIINSQYYQDNKKNIDKFFKICDEFGKTNQTLTQIYAQDPLISADVAFLPDPLRMNAQNTILHHAAPNSYLETAASFSKPHRDIARLPS